MHSFKLNHSVGNMVSSQLYWLMVSGSWHWQITRGGLTYHHQAQMAMEILWYIVIKWTHTVNSLWKIIVVIINDTKHKKWNIQVMKLHIQSICFVWNQHKHFNDHQEACKWLSLIMMTSSNGKIFCVTGPLCREFTGLRWIPCTKASDAELWCFLWSGPE